MMFPRSFTLCRRIAPIIFLPALAVLAGCGVPSERNGIVTLAPHITETVFSLGEGDRIVGVGDFDDYPARALQLPRMGGYTDPDLEKLTLLSPALIVVPGRHEQVTEFGKMNGISVLNVHMDSFATIFDGIGTLGLVLGVPERAAALSSKIKSDLEAIRAAVAPFERRKVLIVLGRQRGDLSNLQTVGGTSFLSELVAVAGGDNIYSDADRPYLEASKETIVLEAPDAILEIHAGKSLTKKQQQALYNDWRFLDTVPAVQEGSIYFITDSHALRPGPRVADVAKIIARRLHFGAELPE